MTLVRQEQHIVVIDHDPEQVLMLRGLLSRPLGRDRRRCLDNQRLWFWKDQARPAFCSTISQQPYDNKLLGITQDHDTHHTGYSYIDTASICHGRRCRSEE